MADICLYFQVHQPYRLLPYDFFQIGENASYHDDVLNSRVLTEVAERCYLPANKMFRDLARLSGGEFRFAMSFSGIFLEQCEKYRPDVLASFKDLVQTGCVEILCETYYHSLAAVFSMDEFVEQVQKQKELLAQTFGVSPQVLRNTELIYNDDLADLAEQMGFAGVLAEGMDHMANGHNGGKLHEVGNARKILTIPRNRGFSDDVAFRRVDPNWKEFPLSVDKFAGWIADTPTPFAGVFLNYEVIGEHQRAETGVFEFWQGMPEALARAGVSCRTPSQLTKSEAAQIPYCCRHWTSWVDQSNNLSAWLGNVIQEEAARKIYQMEAAVKASQSEELIDLWRKMQTSDHFHYMTTQKGADSHFHEQFCPYGSPYDSYIFYMNALSDLQIRVQRNLEMLEVREGVGVA